LFSRRAAAEALAATVAAQLEPGAWRRLRLAMALTAKTQ